MATHSPQHDAEGRSATILPGVPLPEWALPAGPVAPEPEVADQAPPPPVEAPAPAEALVLAGAPARDAEVGSTPEPSPPPAYAAPLPIGAHGPGPMRAGWDYPGSDFREQAHEDALAEAEAALEPEAPATIDPELALALTAPVPLLEPLAAPGLEPVATGDGWTVPAPVPADATAPAEAQPVATSPEATVVPDADADEDPSAETPSSRNLVALGALGAVVVAGAVAAFLWPGLLVSHEPDPVPVIPPVSAPAADATPTTPAAVGSFTKLAGAPAAALAKAVSGSSLPGLSTPVSAVYGTGATPALTVIAWKSAAPLGAAAIPTAFAGFQGATSAVVTDITTTPVSAAGEMRCGTTVVSGAPASLCFWADESTFGSVTVLAPASAEAAADTATAVRAAVVGG